MSRWQLVWWWRPFEWRFGSFGPFPESGAIYSYCWQFGPLEIRRWEASS